jgi:hypothetical protein
MSTSKSTQGSSPRSDPLACFGLRSPSPREGENKNVGKRLMLIDSPESSQKTTPRTSCFSSGQEGSSSQSQRPDEKTISTVEVSTSSLSSGFKAGVVEKISSESSKTILSLGEVREAEEEGESILLMKDKVLAENIETVLNSFEIFDPNQRDQIRQTLADEQESSEAYEAVEQVCFQSMASIL